MQVMEESKNKYELIFTGNWFIDAGILGFVNLMEEVYGWDLETLKCKINKNSEEIFYYWFPFAYIYDNYKRKFQNSQTVLEYINNIKDRFVKNNNIPNDKNNLFDNVKKWIDILSKEPYSVHKLTDIVNKILKDDKRGEIEENIEKELCNIFYSSELTDLQQLIYKINNIRKTYKNISYKKIMNEEKDDKIIEIKKDIKRISSTLSKAWEDKSIDDKTKLRLPLSNDFYTNFLFFNNSLNYKKQLQTLYSLIDFDLSQNELTYIGKTINKLLLSEDDFSNEFYTTAIPTSIFKNEIPFLFCFLICFNKAFISSITSGNIFFYASNLDFTYNVNKKLIKFIELIKDREYDSNSILRMTLQSIIDTLVEHKGIWSLENMYIIQYEKLNNQIQKNVEYIGIPKLQSSIILDDRIRENLNKTIRYRKKDRGYESKWLLEEFIKGKPLYPIILEHCWLALSKKTYLAVYSILYAVAIEANLRSLNRRTNKLFNRKFFGNRYKDLLDNIKYDINKKSNIMNIIKDLFTDDEKESLAYELFVTLKAKNMTTFLYILLKNLNNKLSEVDSNKIKLINNYIYNSIIREDEIWEMNSLPIVIGLMK